MVHVDCLAPLVKPRWLLVKGGLWPMENTTPFIAIKYVLNFLFDVIILAIVLHNIYNAVTTHNINLLNWMTCVLLPLVNYFTKAVTLFTNKSYLNSILDDLKGDTFNQHSDKLNRHIQKIYRISNMIIRYFAIVLTTFISIFAVLPIITNIRPIIPASFDTGRYDIIYNIGHLIASVFMASISTAFDVFNMSLMALCAAQINILGERLTNILEDAQEMFAKFGKIRGFTSVGAATEFILRESVILHEAINQ